MLKLHKKRGRCKYLPFGYLCQNEIKKKFINRTSFGDTLETIQMNSPHF